MSINLSGSLKSSEEFCTFSMARFNLLFIFRVYLKRPYVGWAHFLSQVVGSVSDLSDSFVGNSFSFVLIISLNNFVLLFLVLQISNMGV